MANNSQGGPNFREYAFKTSTGSEVIPVSNGSYFTDLLSRGLDQAEFYIEFYSDASGLTAATPTAGTITVAGSPLGNNYLSDQANLTVQASACGTPNSTYTPPVLDGLSRRGRMILTGITGATHCRAILFKRG